MNANLLRVTLSLQMNQRIILTNNIIVGTDDLAPALYPFQYQKKAQKYLCFFLLIKIARMLYNNVIKKNNIVQVFALIKEKNGKFKT